MDFYDRIYTSIMSNPNAISSILESAELRPSHEDLYPISDEISSDMDLPPYYRSDTKPTWDAAISYVQSVLPGVQVEPFSNEGRTAVVLHDGQYAYKVFRQRSRGYNLVENEVAALEALGREGIAPRPLALIDAAVEHRFGYANYAGNRPVPLFEGNIEVPRFETSGHLPIIITELQDVGPVTELPRERLATEFNRFALAALRHNLLFEDCRFKYDRSNDKAIVLDVGEVHHPRQYSPEDDDGLDAAQLVQGAFVRFGAGRKAWPKLEELAPASYPDKLAQLYPALFEYCF